MDGGEKLAEEENKQKNEGGRASSSILDEVIEAATPGWEHWKWN